MNWTNECLVGTDGWFEYGADGPSETMDIAAFGWVNYDPTDTTTPAVAVGANKGNETIVFNVVNN
jgi:hypothetical protein